MLCSFDEGILLRKALVMPARYWLPVEESVILCAFILYSQAFCCSITIHRSEISRCADQVRNSGSVPVLNFLIVMSLSLWLIQLVWAGSIEPLHALVAILAVIVLTASALEKSGRFGCAMGILKICIVAAAVITFVGTTEAGPELVQPLGVLFIAALGLYIVVFGISSKNKSE